MQTNYNRGSAFERQLKKKYEAAGYSVHRMAGSHSPIDLIAISSEELMLIQCKSSTTELLPNVKQLLKTTSIDEVRTKVNGQWMKVKQEGKSNVKLLEEMQVPDNTTKLIVWKGKGRENYYSFYWKSLSDTWKGKKGLAI